MRAFKRVLGMDTLDLSGPLTKASVPHIALDEACKACSIPCDPEDMGEYPSMSIDTSSNMVGRVKPFGRQVTSPRIAFFSPHSSGLGNGMGADRSR